MSVNFKEFFNKEKNKIMTNHESRTGTTINLLDVVVPGVCLPAVLVPGLDLRVGEVEGGRQLHAVLDAQVLLPLETALQLGQLVVCEGCPGLPGLLQPDLRAVSAA